MSSRTPMLVSFTPSDNLTETFFQMLDPHCVLSIEDVRDDAAEAVVTVRITRNGRPH